jgi:replication-associated recombination protein RarA
MVQLLFRKRDNMCCQMSYNQPLAERMRPKILDDYAGQQHIAGKGFSGKEDDRKRVIFLQ